MLFFIVFKLKKMRILNLKSESCVLLLYFRFGGS